MNNDVLIQETLAQIQKDFGAMWDQELPNNWDYWTLHQRILETLLKFQSSHTFMSLLYRIDIPESDYRFALNAQNSMEILSEMIIKREFLKVLLRKQFSLNQATEILKQLKG